MAHSLETRVPFLDPVVTNFAFALPGNSASARLRKKVLLRKAVEPLVPDEIVHGRKRGFSIPAAAWLRGELEPFARETLVGEALAPPGLLPARGGKRADRRPRRGREDSRRQLWGLLAFTLWYERHVEHEPAPLRSGGWRRSSGERACRTRARLRRGRSSGASSSTPCCAARRPRPPGSREDTDGRVGWSAGDRVTLLGFDDRAGRRFSRSPRRASIPAGEIDVQFARDEGEGFEIGRRLARGSRALLRAAARARDAASWRVRLPPRGASDEGLDRHHRAGTRARVPAADRAPARAAATRSRSPRATTRRRSSCSSCTGSRPTPCSAATAGARGSARRGRCTSRLGALRRWAQGRGFDVALAHGSHELTITARRLGIPSSTTFDYEFASLQHQLGCRAATRVVVPDAIPPERLERYGVRPPKLRPVPGPEGGVLPRRLRAATGRCSSSSRHRPGARARRRSGRRPTSRSTTGTRTRSSRRRSSTSAATRTCTRSSCRAPTSSATSCAGSSCRR